MNASILTIDKNLIAPVGAAGHVHKADISHAEQSPPPAPGNKSVKANSAPTETPDNVATDTTKPSTAKPSREFREVLREKVGNEALPKAQSPNQASEHSAVSDPTNPQQAVPAWVADNIVPDPQSEDDAAAAVEPEPVSELGQLIAGLKSEQSPPPTGHAVKSDQIKALAATETGQLGLKTVLPEKSNGLNGLQADSPEQATPPTGAGGIPGTNGTNEKILALDGAQQAFGDKLNAGEKVSETLANTGEQTLAANQKAQTTDTPVQSALTDEAISDAEKDLASTAPAAPDHKSTGADGLKAPADVAASSIVANPTEKQLPHATDNLRNNKDHVGPHQLQVRSADANGEEPTGDGTEFANADGLAKAGAIGVHISDGQSKNRDRQPADNGSPQNISQILSHDNSSIQAASQSTVSAASAKSANTPGQNTPADASGDIGRQILESIRSQQDQQGAERLITVRLNPPELGKVFIKLQEHQAELTGVLEVSRSQTRFEIEHALPEIIRNLADSGIQVKRLDVMLSDPGRPEQDTFGGHSMANNGRYGQNPADQDPWADETNLGMLNEWPANNYSHQNYSRSLESYVTDGSINMLI